MVTWREFEQEQSALASVGRQQFYQHGMGLGFIATVRQDGWPRVHPVCPVISKAGLHVLILPGPKRGDLRRDGRYSLHTEMFPPPRQDDGFAVTGRATEITDQGVWYIVRDQVLEDFGEMWPDYENLTLFELSVESCLLTLTHPDAGLPKGPTIWKASSPSVNTGATSVVL